MANVEDYLNKCREYSRECQAQPTNIRFSVVIKINGNWVKKRNIFSDEDDAYAFCVGLIHTNKDVEDYKIMVSNPFIPKHGIFYSARDYYPKCNILYLDEMSTQ